MIKYKSKKKKKKKENVIGEYFKTRTDSKLNRLMRFSLSFALSSSGTWIWKARNPHPRLGIQGSVARLVLTRDNV